MGGSSDAQRHAAAMSSAEKGFIGADCIGDSWRWVDEWQEGERRFANALICCRACAARDPDTGGVK